MAAVNLPSKKAKLKQLKEIIARSVNCELKIISPTEHGVVLQVTFNIIRFPSPHRATLFSLLSHLEKVTGYREVNRMAVANLAIVFGPTLVSFDYLDL